MFGRSKALLDGTHKGVLGVSAALSRMTHKRNRVVAVIMLPIAIFLWVIGWCLFWAGSQRNSHRIRATDNEDFVSITTALPEKQEVLES
jgi:hypothetical protein